MDFRRALLAAALSIAVLFIWQTIFPPAKRPVVEPQPVEERAATVADEGDEGPVATVEDESAADSQPADAALGESIAGATPAGDSDPGAPLVEKVASSEHTMTLETRDFKAEFSNRGAELVSLELWNHEEADGELVELVRRRSPGQAYPFGFVRPSDGEPHPLSDALFVASHGVDEVGNKSLLFEYRGPAGAAQKRFTLTPQGSIEAEIEGEIEATGWAMRWGPGVRNLPDGTKTSRVERRTVVWRRDGDVDREDVGGLDEVLRLGAVELDWVGVDDNYFLSAVLPEEGVREVAVYPVVEIDGALRRTLPDEKVGKKVWREAEILLVPEGDRLRVAAYLGTRELGQLAELPRDLADGAAHTGFWGPLTRPLQSALRWIYANIVHNYGWAIVLLTFLIKVLLFPLTQKSMVSMARMQEVNPKIQSIRGKYRPKLKDKQGRPNAEAQRKMNEEIMALYKAEGVNPASGCLPMLVQLPIFFALFRLLNSAIELRNAPWVFWIKDLAAADPLFVLPVLMGASQLLQQKMTPMTGDPMQRRLMTFMPIMFVVFAFAFPSGLVLYWLTSNLLTIVQNSLYNRWKKRATGET